MTGKNYEPPLFLDMDFAEALERFAGTDPKEVKELMERSKKKPPGSETPTAKPPRRKATPSSGSGGRDGDH